MKQENIYQIKITLCDELPIWRRVVIPGDYTFSDFHVAIQDAMGWLDCHLHEFEVTNPVTGNIEIIGITDDERVVSVGENEIISGMKRKVSEILSIENNKAKCIYDYGDYWVHQIEVEDIRLIARNSKYPQCVHGVGACPPEDCGGISEYKILLTNINSEPNNDKDVDYVQYHWHRHLRENAFRVENIFFREPPSKQEVPKEEHQLWMRKLLQGKIYLDELKQDLCSQIPYEDIEVLYDCVQNKPLYYRNRSLGILSLCKGIPHDIISEYLFISRGSLFRNLKVYQSKGVSPIISDKGKRLLKHENPKYIEKLFSILHSPPSEHGFNRTTWKQDDIQKVMSDNNMPVSKSVISKIVNNSGYKYRKARTVLTSNDPQYKEKIKKIKKILSSLGPKEIFFSIDEYGPFAVKLQGGKSLVPPGTTKTVPQWQKSKGSIIITAALELSTNQITHFYSKNKNTTEMIKLLNILVDKYSDEECIYFSWDAASWHASKELNKRVEEINSKGYKAKTKLPIVKLAPLPTCAQFLNVIESVFSGMARAIIHNSNYQSVEECKTAIDRYFIERNEHFEMYPKRAGKKIWGRERVKASFSESNNCKDPMYR